ncbi:hypothetical protein [Streptomyces sp. NPDC047974]|uniref:hypothetical protein n=1 Tax=Streptomyces sp. NPDC047974 TaxID=3154343 RepID=UPI00340CF6FE
MGTPKPRQAPAAPKEHRRPGGEQRGERARDRRPGDGTHEDPDRQGDQEYDPEPEVSGRRIVPQRLLG